MRKRKAMGLCVIIFLFISGCATGSKTAKPTDTPERLSPAERPVAEILLPAVYEVPQIKEEFASRQQVRMTYSQITNRIGRFLDIQAVEDDIDRNKFLGISEDSLVTIEIVGEESNISQASMKLIYPKDIAPINIDLNNAMMLRFLRNIAPEFKRWPASVEDITEKFHTMNIGSIDEDEIALGEKIIQILYDRNIDSITVLVKIE